MKQRRRLTLRNRVLISFVATASILLSVNVISTAFITAELYSQLDHEISSQATSLLSYAAARPASTPAIDNSYYAQYEVIEINRPGQSPTIVGPPDGVAALAHAVSTNQNLTHPTPKTANDSSGVTSLGWRFYTALDPKTHTTVTVGHSLDSLTLTRSRIILELTIASLVSLIALFVLSVWIVTIGIRPLVKISEIARKIANGQRALRVDVPAQAEGTEIEDVAIALNTALDALTAAIETQENSNEELRRFVADAGHELRTPLTSISGYLELLSSRTLLPASQDEAYTRINSEVGRMRRLVEDLLSLARLEVRAGLRYEYFDLSEVLNDLVLDHQALDSGHSVVASAEKDIYINADYGQMSSIISNLLANLRAHTPVGTTATITLTQSPPTSPTKIILTYEDTGPGVKDPAELFTRFWQEDPGRDSPGSGLGMAITAAAVKAHGGKIYAAKAAPHGLSITITLPVQEQPPEKS